MATWSYNLKSNPLSFTLHSGTMISGPSLKEIIPTERMTFGYILAVCAFIFHALIAILSACYCV